MMDVNYNPHAMADGLENAANVLDDYREENLEENNSGFDGLPYAKDDSVSPYAVSEAIESVPIPGINS